MHMLDGMRQMALYSKCVDEPLHMNVINMYVNFLGFPSLKLSIEASSTDESEDIYTWKNVENEQHIWETFYVSSENKDEMFKSYPQVFLT